MKQVVFYILLASWMSGCKKSEPEQLTVTVRVLNADFFDAGLKPGVLLKIEAGSRIDIPKNCASSVEVNVVRAINLPDSLLQPGLRLQIQFRMATAGEYIARACYDLRLAGCEPPQIKLLRIQR